MMKQLSAEPQDQTEPIHQVEDPRCYQNYLPYDYPKTIDPKGGSQEEDFRAEEDSLVEEEDSLEEGDTPEEEEYHPGDHQEEDGDHHRFQCSNRNKENW